MFGITLDERSSSIEENNIRGDIDMENKSKKALIIGAGPAGLTAAYELLKNTDIKPVIIEESDAIGGISRTAEHNGNRIDTVKAIKHTSFNECLKRFQYLFQKDL